MGCHSWWSRLFLAVAAIGQALAHDCRHGTYDNDTQKCICDKHWATAGITDTVDFLEGVCEQFQCQSDEQCRELLGAWASCPVKNWNCYCGWAKSWENGNRGFETEGAECMGVMYTLSVWSTENLLDIYEHAWKFFVAAALLCFAFGRKRSRCDHYDVSLWNDVRRMFGYVPTCNGGCPMEPEYNFDAMCDDLAWSIYILGLMVWFHLFLLVIFVLAFFIWSILLWAMVMIMLVVALIAGACTLCGLAGGEGGGACCEGGCDCSSLGSCGAGDCCYCCFGDGVTGNYSVDGLMYWSGTYPESNLCDCCYTTAPSPQDSSCCFIFMAPIAWMVKRFPRMPDNAWGGLLGCYVFATHRHTPQDRVYAGGNAFIDFFSLQWLRRADLHEDADWRDQVHEFLMDQARGPNPRDMESGAQASDGETASLVGNRQAVGLATCIKMNEPFNKERDRCVPSSFEDYEANQCWICQTSNAEWDLWLTCGHMYCSRCSTEMLRRRMPCPLCRRASTAVQRRPHPLFLEAMT